MKFGICTGLSEAQAFLNVGFDYIEVAASGFQGLSENWDPTPYQGLPILATNGFFDPSIRLFGPDATPWQDYARRTVARAAEIGVQVMVLGSGASRRAPAGIDGEASFADLCAEIAEIAKPSGITVAPEPLNRTETNVGTRQRELALRLNERDVAYTADTYHVLAEWDADGWPVTPDELWVKEVPLAPAHVHLSDVARMAPKGDDEMLYGFVRRLKELGYDGLVSLECRRSDGFDPARALGSIKQLFQA